MVYSKALQAWLGIIPIYSVWVLPPKNFLKASFAHFIYCLIGVLDRCYRLSTATAAVYNVISQALRQVPGIK